MSGKNSLYRLTNRVAHKITTIEPFRPRNHQITKTLKPRAEIKELLYYKIEISNGFVAQKGIIFQQQKGLCLRLENQKLNHMYPHLY